jgi:hypothetical protein
MATVTEEGVPILPPGAAPTPAMKEWLAAEADRFRRSILPRAAERKDVAAELLGLFAAFPAQALSDAAAEARARHYLAAMSGFPLGAVRAAIAAWMRGEHSGPHDNHAFPPSPPQLARLARIALAPVLSRIDALEALARAEARPPPSSTESRARVAALAEAFRRGACAAEDAGQTTDDGGQATEAGAIASRGGRRSASPSAAVRPPSSGSRRPSSA